MTQPVYERFIALPGTYNLRDLGGYPASEKPTGWRRILRSDSPHLIGEHGVTRLLDEGVRTVIDLRWSEEVSQSPNPFAEQAGVTYRNISLFDGLAPGLQPKGDVLLDLYLEALTTRKDKFALVLTEIAEAPEGAVLFHCTAGKDRTGLVAALILSLAGVERRTIISDYALTADAIAPMVEKMMANARERGMNPALLQPLMACHPDTIATAIDRLTDLHGTAETYLLEAGMARNSLTRLKARLLD